MVQQPAFYVLYCLKWSYIDKAFCEEDFPEGQINNNPDRKVHGANMGPNWVWTDVKPLLITRIIGPNRPNQLKTSKSKVIWQDYCVHLVFTYRD